MAAAAGCQAVWKRRKLYCASVSMRASSSTAGRSCSMCLNRACAQHSSCQQRQQAAASSAAGWRCSSCTTKTDLPVRGLQARTWLSSACRCWPYCCALPPDACLACAMCAGRLRSVPMAATGCFSRLSTACAAAVPWAVRREMRFSGPS